ncbi:Hypothetical protein SMAX5B_011665 [Scophthalmus maximus]|uniref:Uncharacterized protein n=1 Tax=Scophthalmus maximus TaxID=52904 RepID=A0A2U9AXF6_SCOMX|nr:Hypothetical protein SMAX5B_011665 [Scophthalmus maximus]
MKWRPSSGQVLGNHTEAIRSVSFISNASGYIRPHRIGESFQRRTRWVKGALATQHLTLTRSGLRSSRRTGMVLTTLRRHAGDLAVLSTAFLADNDKDPLLNSSYFCTQVRALASTPFST